MCIRDRDAVRELRFTSPTPVSSESLFNAVPSGMVTVISLEMCIRDRYSAIGDKMKSTDLSSAFTIYNDKQMKTEYTNYTKTCLLYTSRCV